MASVPDEAFDRFHELKLPAAKVLYVGYCRFRNTLTGRCLTRNAKIAARAGLNEAYLSTAKTELLKKGWGVKDPEFPQYGFIPLVGIADFERRRRDALKAMSDEKFWIFQNSREKIWDFQKNFLDIPKFSGRSLIYVPGDHTNLSTTSSSDDENLDIPKFSSSSQRTDSEPCDELYVERLIEAGAFPPQLTPANVRFTFRELKFDCAERVPPCAPTKREFKGWLRTAAKSMPQQALLPHTGGAEIVTPDFQQAHAPAADSPLQFYSLCTGNPLKERDHLAFERVKHLEPVVIKAGILYSILHANAHVNSFNYCVQAIEYFAAPESMFLPSYFNYLFEKFNQFVNSKPHWRVAAEG